MRSVIVFLVVAAACSKPKPDAAVETYANTQMAIAIARAREGYAVLGDLKVEDYGKPELVKRLAQAGQALRVAHEAASTITAPAMMSTPHSDFLVATETMKSDVDDLVVAAGLGLQSKFAGAHAKLMEAVPYWFSWEERFARQLQEAHVTFVPAANLPPLPEAATPIAAPPKPEQVAAPAPPCKPGTEVKKGERLVACELETGATLLDLICGPGKATFDEADGQIIGCINDSVFALPYETSVARENVVTCGPGPVTRKKTGGFASCTTFGAVMVGQTEIVRQSLVTIGDKLAVTSATAPDGTRRCFDGAGKLIPCT